MKRTVRRLNVLMNGYLVGILEKMMNGSLSFHYHSEWLDLPGARPISLSLPLVNRTFSGDLVYNFFDNLLPDNHLVRSQIQTKFQTITNQPFDLLAAIGRDCIGAIQMIEDMPINFPEEISFKYLKEKEVADILRNIKFNPLGMSDYNEHFRISVAGAQEKTALLYWNKKWCEPLNMTPTTHLFKLPIGFIPHQHIDLRDSCENEWLCSQITAAFGLPVAKCDIQFFEDIKVLVVERFDRALSSDGSWLMRLPQEDFCQALGVSSNLKYQAEGGPGIKEIMGILLGSANATKDRDLFFRSQVLFWLLAAIDGHAKNFSLFLEAGAKYRLTPLYDIMSAYPLLATKQLEIKKIKMAMALRGKNNHYHWYELNRRYFLETAKFSNYSSQDAEIILDDMLDRVETIILEVSEKLPKEFPQKIAQTIFKGMRSTRDKLLK